MERGSLLGRFYLGDEFLRLSTLKEEGSGYLVNILSALLLKDSNSFNKMMNLFLDDCFNDGESNLCKSINNRGVLK
jgi:hypothetical protein